MVFIKFLKVRIWFVLAASVFFLCSLPVQAQTMTGSIIGVVQDASEGIIVGAQTTLTSSQLPGGALISVTNEFGEYRFTRLEPGIYTLRVESPGFSLNTFLNCSNLIAPRH
jgi:hypothetical protein